MSDKIEQLKQWYEQEQIRIKQEFDSKLKELEKKELETLIRRVKEFEFYWTIESSTLTDSREFGDNMDLERFNRYNYFHTKEEAQKVQARELLARALARKDGEHENVEWLPDWNDSKQTKYCICYDSDIYFEDYYNKRQQLAFKDNNQISIFRKYISDDEIRQFLEG